MAILFGNVLPHKFIFSHIFKDEKSKTLDTISSIPLPTDCVHELIKAALVTYGYEDTYRSFVAESAPSEDLEPTETSQMDGMSSYCEEFEQESHAHR
ncbi:hypothetical protein HK102_010989 [Quaeritorhiza haematococci]|nr:hypothetical protein HK102_010989 [Quaeritorhiza haematococci]